MDPIGAPPPGIERLARLYRALSDTNKAIVRMRDRGSLFREVRRIAVEQAGLEFAWLGLLGDEGLEREPVATLAAIALCSGGSHVCNRLPAEMAPYRAGTALLLREGDRVVGVMVLLARHEGCFDRALLDLVEEMATDVSYALENLAREARRAATESSLRKLSHAVEQSSAATVITDVEGRIEYANPKFTEISGYTLEEVRGRPPSLLKGGSTPRHVYEELWTSLRAGRQWHGELQNRRKSGELYWEYEIVSPVRNADGEIVSYIAVKEDITERKRTELELLRVNRTLRLVSECNQVLVVAKDESHLLQSICRAIVRTGGYACAQVTLAGSAAPAASAAEGRDSPDESASLALVLSKDRQVFGKLTIRTREPGFTLEEHELLREMADDLAYGIGALRVAQMHERHLAHRAHHDPLTGLANRNLLDDRLEQAVAAARRYGRPMAVVYLDLDHFKIVNDSLGHRAGDELLGLVGARLLGVVRDVDTVARAGGDEFAIVLYDAQGEDDVLATMQHIQAALGAPFCVDGHEVHVECSLGASVFPRDGADARSLLKNADAAMYNAKDSGRNSCRFYTAQMNASVATRLDTVQGLRRALQHRHFELHYQPLVSATSGAIVGAEALLRWRHPERGLVQPSQFIQVAEETGLIVPMGEWVLDAACAQNAKWREQGHAIVVAVNLSAGQLHHEGLADAVRHALGRHGLAAGGLELELTESTLMKNVADAAATLHALSALGVRLALDDFGTGYSSLSYLKRFPVHKLKIDQSFVRDISRDVDDAAIVTAVIAMAKSLGLRVIAEGIETREQLDFLRGHGCDELQGHLLGRALPAEAFGALLAAQRSGRVAF